MTPRRSWRFVGVLATAAVVGTVLVIVLWPAPVDRPYYGMLVRWLRSLHHDAGFGWVSYGMIEQLGNVLLFVPLGAAMTAIWRRRPWTALLACVLASVAIEIAQALFLPTRRGTVLDVVLNSIGAAIGVGAVLLVRRLARPRDRQRASGGIRRR